MREESSKPGPNLPFLLDLHNFFPQILHWSKTGCIQFCPCCAFLLFCWATRNVVLFHVYVICPSPTKAPTCGRCSDPSRSDGYSLLSSSPRPRAFLILNHIFRVSVPHQSLISLESLQGRSVSEVSSFCLPAPMCKSVYAQSLHRVQLCATPRTVACQVPLPMGLSRQEYWSGLPCPPPGDLPNPGIEPRSPALQAGSLPLSHLGSHSPSPGSAKWKQHGGICRMSLRRFRKGSLELRSLDLRKWESGMGAGAKAGVRGRQGTGQRSRQDKDFVTCPDSCSWFCKGCVPWREREICPGEGVGTTASRTHQEGVILV